MPHEIVDHATWLKARQDLLVKEKQHTQARAELARQRRELPWVKLEKNYTFTGPDGEVALSDLFEDSSQLAVYHLMFGRGWEAPCIGCTQWANALNGTTASFVKADARLIAISRAPIEEIARQREKLGWTFTWVSSDACDFNVDFYASADDTNGTTSQPVGGQSSGAGTERVHFDRGENHGVSVFCKNDAGEIFHTYSAYNRGIEALNGAFGYYDLLPKGRAW